MKTTRGPVRFRLASLLLMLAITAIPLAIYAGRNHHRAALTAIHNDDVAAIRWLALSHPEAIRCNRYGSVFQTALRTGSTEMLELLIGIYQPADLLRENTLSSAIHSHRGDRLQCIQLILNRSITSPAAIHEAIELRDSGIHFLLNRGVKVDEAVAQLADKSLLAALEEQDAACLEALLQCGATVDKEILLLAARQGREELLAPLLSASTCQPSELCCVLTVAIETAHSASSIDRLLQYGVPHSAKCSHCKRTPAETAWEHRHLRQVAWLLHAGAETGSVDLAQVLLAAANQGDLGLCQRLMPQKPWKKREAAINDAWKINALRYWSNTMTIDAAAMLLKVGSDPNTLLPNGRTALHRLADAKGPWTNKHVEICMQVFRHGADPFMQDDQGRQAITNPKVQAAWDRFQLNCQSK